MKKWNPPVPDEQMIIDAQLENTMRDIVRWEETAGGRSVAGVDRDGNVLVLGCGRGPRSRDRDPNLKSQDEIENGSQVIGADDEWA